MLRLLTIFALSGNVLYVSKNFKQFWDILVLVDLLAILITVSLGEPQDLQFLLAKENEKPQISMNNSAEDSDDTNREGEKGKPMLIQGAAKKRFIRR